MFEVRCRSCGFRRLLAPGPSPRRGPVPPTVECPLCHDRDPIDTQALLAARIAATRPAAPELTSSAPIAPGSHGSRGAELGAS
jgi:hypothetical protein